ncbi:Aminodeoxyfutalosine deaminase [compost metagenome]
MAKLGTNRIGHGVRLKEDKDLLERVREQRIPLEFCPISNIQTKASTSWGTYPIREYFDQGLLITVNTDNLTVSDTNMTKEIAVLVDHFQFTLSEIEQIVLNSVEAAFLEEEEKRQLHEEIVKSFSEI